MVITECSPAGRLSRDQGARDNGGGRYHGYQQHNEGYATQLRGHLSPECNPRPLQNHRRELLNPFHFKRVLLDKFYNN